MIGTKYVPPSGKPSGVPAPAPVLQVPHIGPTSVPLYHPFPFQEGSSPSKIQGPVMGVEVTPTGGVTAHTLQQEPLTIQQQVQPHPNRPKEERS